jgi:hypothetical protein
VGRTRLRAQYINQVARNTGAKNAHTYIVHNYITYTPTCFAASTPSSGNLCIMLLKLQNNKITELHKAVGRRMVYICLYSILYLFIFIILIWQHNIQAL